MFLNLGITPYFHCILFHSKPPCTEPVVRMRVRRTSDTRCLDVWIDCPCKICVFNQSCGFARIVRQAFALSGRLNPARICVGYKTLRSFVNILIAYPDICHKHTRFPTVLCSTLSPDPRMVEQIKRGRWSRKTTALFLL